jgi:hypothetical protein
MADPKNTKPQSAGNYAVGYKKPPAEHQFKPLYLREAAQKTRNRRNEKAPDVAALIARPRKVRRGGKVISMHPFEAELTSLGKRALNGEPRATKLFLEYCDIAGLLEAPAWRTNARGLRHAEGR